MRGVWSDGVIIEKDGDDAYARAAYVCTDAANHDNSGLGVCSNQLVTENAKLMIEIKRRRRLATHNDCFRKFSDIEALRASFETKFRKPTVSKAEALETMRYGCVTWFLNADHQAAHPTPPLPAAQYQFSPKKGLVPRAAI